MYNYVMMYTFAPVIVVMPILFRDMPAIIIGILGVHPTPVQITLHLGRATVDIEMPL
jgi:hypothetical protein